VESRAHLAEDLIGLVRDGGVPLTAEIVDCLMETADILRRMLDETVRTRADVDPAPSEGLMDKLRVLIAKHGGAGGEAAPSEADTPLSVDPTPVDQTPDPEMAQDLVQEHALADTDAQTAPADAVPEPAFETRRKTKPKTKAKVAPVEAAAEEVPLVPDAAQGAASLPTDGPSAAALSLDAGYKAIFLEMVEATLADLTAMQGGDLAPARGKADGLGYAAGQLGLADWAATLAGFTAGDATDDSLAGLIADLQTLSARDFGTAAAPAATDVAQIPAPAAEQAGQEAEHNILADFEPLISRVADLGLQMAGDTPPDAQTLGQLADDIDALVLPQGLVRLSQAGHAFSAARELEQFRRAQLAFFEELAALEGVLPEAMVEAALMRPSAILRSWAADHIFATLQDLRLGLEATSKASGADWFKGFEPLMRRAFHACAHFRMETAAQLTMALVDLFARSRAEGRVPDVILIQIARGFVDTMELVFDTLDQGDTPDIARIEQLFEEAATVSFVASGVVTARVIEEKLGLPREFHRVLSPESVKAAQSAIDAGMRFYVIRSDLNGDDALAEGFPGMADLCRRSDDHQRDGLSGRCDAVRFPCRGALGRGPGGRGAGAIWTRRESA
jgi:two-component system, chemotaxis family, sensor kinase CheA